MWVQIEEKLINTDALESIEVVETMVASKVYALAFTAKSGRKFVIGKYAKGEADEILETLSNALIGVDDVDEDLIVNTFAKIGHC